MAVRPILVVEHPILRQKAKKVQRVDASIVRLIDDLAESMIAAEGAGLAAPQIGVGLRVFVVRGDEGQIHALVNPEVVKAEGAQVGYEACLSIPGYVGEVERAESVVMKGLNRRGKEIRVKASGYRAVALQHERDHLDGILYTDKLTRLETYRRVEEHEAELARAEADDAGDTDEPARAAS